MAKLAVWQRKPPLRYELADAGLFTYYYLHFHLPNSISMLANLEQLPPAQRTVVGTGAHLFGADQLLTEARE